MKGSFAEKIKKIFTGVFGKKLARNTNTAVLITAIVAIAIVFNLLLELFPINIDLTTEKLYSLTETTEKVLDELEDDVTVYALYDRIEGENDTYQSQVIKVLDLYNKAAHVEVEYVDIDRKPAFLKELVGETNATLYSEGDYIVKHGDKIRRIDGDDITETEIQYDSWIPYEITTGLQIETRLTSAILKVFSDVPVIYYSTGFGELSQSSFSTIASYIDSSGFDLKEIDLKAENFEENAVAIMFFGPTQDLTGEASDKLERWLDSGGNAFFFMDILNLAADNAYIYNEFENFSELLKRYGIILKDSLVEESDNYAQATDEDKIFHTTTISAGSLSEMTSTKLYISNTRALAIDTMLDLAEPEVILETSSGAKATSLSDGKAMEGKQIIGVSSKYTGAKEISQVAVFGSSHTFSDLMMTFWGTAPQLVLRHTMDWMDLEVSENVGDSIEAKQYNTGTSRVDITDVQLKWIVISVMVIVPLVILTTGLIVWIKRRHL